MVERRALMGGGLLAGLTTMMATEASEAAVADDGQVSGAIDALRKTVEDQFDAVYTSKWRAVGRIRQQQRTWIRATQKFPDFIEIGIDVWDNIYDWHVAHQQPVSMARTADGRYAMVFMFTTLLLRPEQAADFVGYAFDADAPRQRVP
jgi:hypothetical protein